ncbi:MAG: YihY/virulence factor BrkB family protein [Rubrivivax sp.]
MRLSGKLSAAWALVRDSVAAWSDDYAPSMGAALSYYTFFSLAPLLLIVVSVAGLVFGADAARGHLVNELSGLIGTDSARALEDMIASVNQPGKGVLATVIGVLTMLIGATTVFGELQDALDRIWQAPVRDRSAGFFKLLRTRVLSFGMILAFGFLLVVSLVVSAGISALGQWWKTSFGGWQVLAQVVNFAVGFAITTVMFALVYKLMPRVKVAWRDVWIGAAVTSILFTVGRLLIGLYIGMGSLASGYGAAGSLVIVLVWVYYSAQVFLLGAEFTWVFAGRYGSMRAKGLAAKAGAPSVPAAPAGARGAVPQRSADIAPVALPAPSTESVSNPPGLGRWLLAGAAAGGVLAAQHWLATRARSD